MISVYQLKPRFQALLRPYVTQLAAKGVTANQVTLAAAAGSVVIGAVVAWLVQYRPVFLLIAFWFPVRMALNAVDGISCVEPQGAFYAFPNITGTGLTADELAGRLLAEAGVAALAGTAFGRQGEGFLRFSYANSVANIQAALDAIKFVLA